MTQNRRNGLLRRYPKTKKVREQTRTRLQPVRWKRKSVVGNLCVGTRRWRGTCALARNLCVGSGRRATPVVCGKACCSDNEMCIAETCAVRPAVAEMFRGPSWPREVGATAVGWAPPFFAGGLLREVALNMHKVFPHMGAFNHRRDSNDLHAQGQCYVVGNPSSLAQCPMNNVFDKGCQGEVGELEQVGQVVIDDPNPRLVQR